MTLDIRGSLKNTKLSSGKFVIFEELLSNSIDAYLFRKSQEPSVAPLKVNFVLKFWSTDLLDAEIDLSISCTDNGCGLGDEQTSAFLTKDTSYKDDLPIAGIGKCKGAGRIQYFHHFSKMEIDSTYQAGPDIRCRKLAYTESQKTLEDKSFEVSDCIDGNIGTTINLVGLKQTVRTRIFKNEVLTKIFSAENLKRKVLVAFLLRLVSLADVLGQFEISFETRFKDQIDTQSLLWNELPAFDKVYPISVHEIDPGNGEKLETIQELTVTHYKLAKAQFDLGKNSIVLCAKSTSVKDITGKYLRTRTLENRPIDDLYHLVLVEGAVLDRTVSEERDCFDGLPEVSEVGDFFSTERVSLQSIYEALEEPISRLLSPPDWNRDDVVRQITSDYGLSEGMLIDTETRIQFGETARGVVERVLKKYQEDIVNTTEEIVSLKDEIVGLDPTSDDFRTKVNLLAWKYTASLTEVDKANLSQLVVRRAAIVEVLALACRLALSMQAPTAGEKQKNESIVHSIFFPMRADSTGTTDHDIWLLSEDYQYFEYIASDLPLSSIKIDADTPYFESGIDEDLAEIFAKTTSENAGKRPDIALFTKEGAAVIIEFKAPEVSMQDHDNDLMEYAQLLAAKSGGKLKRFYAYLIGGSINRLRVSAWNRSVSGGGYFRTVDIVEPETGVRIGQLYSELLPFDDIIVRAKTRLRAYQERLGLSIYRDTIEAIQSVTVQTDAVLNQTD